MVKRTRLSWDEAYSICLEYLWHSYNKWYTRRELDRNYTKWITWLIIKEHRRNYWKASRDLKPICFSFADEDSEKFSAKEPEWSILEYWPIVEEAIGKLEPDLRQAIIHRFGINLDGEAEVTDGARWKAKRTRKERKLDDLAIYKLKGEIRV